MNIQLVAQKLTGHSFKLAKLCRCIQSSDFLRLSCRKNWCSIGFYMSTVVPFARLCVNDTVNDAEVIQISSAPKGTCLNGYESNTKIINSIGFTDHVHFEPLVAFSHLLTRLSSSKQRMLLNHSHPASLSSVGQLTLTRCTDETFQSWRTCIDSTCLLSLGAVLVDEENDRRAAMCLRSSLQLHSNPFYQRSG